MIAWDARRVVSIVAETAIITSGLATGAANRQQMMMSSFTFKDLTIARTVTANYSRKKAKSDDSDRPSTHADISSGNRP